MATRTTGDCKMQHDDKSEMWEDRNKEIKDKGKELGHGSYSHVYQWGKDKVLKVCDITEDGIMFNDIAASRYPHNNHLLRAKGVIFHNDAVGNPYYSLIYPLGKCTLYDKMKDSYVEYTLQQRFEHCYQVAAALRAMHSTDFLHLDIKPANIIIMQDNTAALTDFSLSVLKGNREVIFTTVRRTTSGTRSKVGYRPPENLHDNIYGTFTDVWSWGILFFTVVLRNGIYAVENRRKTGNAGNVLRYVEQCIALSQIDDTDRRAKTKSALQDIARGIFVSRDKRVSMKWIITHPLFREIAKKESTTISEPLLTSVTTISESDSKRTLRGVNWLLNRCSDMSMLGCPTNVLYEKENEKFAHMVTRSSQRPGLDSFFLAVDLYYRSYSLHKDDFAEIADACLAIAMHICDEPLRANFMRNGLQSHCKAIILHLKGMLYRPYLLAHCRNNEDIIKAYKEYILQPQNYFAYKPPLVMEIVDTTSLDVGVLMKG